MRDKGNAVDEPKRAPQQYILIDRRFSCLRAADNKIQEEG
jgi:hypothetical protein